MAATVPAALVLLLHPHTVDLAAHEFRSELFEREGFTIWNGHWYGGHHTPAYSVLFPPLAALLGPLVVGVLSSLAAAVLFERLVRAHFGPPARWGALWFGAATGVNLFTGRLPFALGVAIGLASLLAFQRGRPVAAAALAVACSLASPVAALFLALGGVACALAGPHRLRRSAALVVAAALVPPLALAGAFPEGGRFPFAFSAFFPLPLLALAATVALPRRERVLRTGAVLYGLAGIAAFAVETPVGANAARLGALVGGPVLACALLGRATSTRRRALLGAGLAALAVWQWGPAARDLGDALSDPAAQEAFYRPVIDFLERHDDGAGRVEIVPTRAHRETAVVADRFPLARGWQRQLDIRHNRLFYEGRLRDEAYARWLRELAVRFVALPDSSLDYSGEGERRLVERDPPYLNLRWRSEHWRVYEVTPPGPLVIPEAGADIGLDRLGPVDLQLDVERPGAALVRVRWTPYWTARGGCVERSGQWTRVHAERPGPLQLRVSFSPARLASRGERCAAR